MQLDKRTIRAILLIVFISLVMLMLLLHLGEFFAFWGWIAGILMPVIVGLSLAFIVGLPMSFFERTFLSGLERSRHRFVRGLRRPLALILAYLVILGGLAALLLTILPELASTVLNLANQLPGYAESFFLWLQDIALTLHLPAQELLGDTSLWTNLVQRLSEVLKDSALGVLTTATGFTTGLFSWLTTAFMGFVISLYVLLQREGLAGRCRMLLAALLPRPAYQAVIRFFRLCNRAFSSFLAGQCLEALLVGLVCFVGMLVLRLPYAGAVSAVICVTALVPMIGPIVGATIGTLLILLIDPLKALIFLVFIIIWQQIEGNLIYPRVVGKNVGLPPLLVIAAVIVGSALDGMLGILVAIPMFSVFSQLGKEAVRRRLRKKGIPEGYPED